MDGVSCYYFVFHLSNLFQTIPSDPLEIVKEKRGDAILRGKSDTFTVTILLVFISNTLCHSVERCRNISIIINHISLAATRTRQDI